MEDVCTLDADLTSGDLVHWHVGHNDWGYSPDPEHVTCHETASEARDALTHNISNLAEYLADTCEHPRAVKGCDECRDWSAAFAVLHILTNGEGDGQPFAMGGGVRFELSDGRTLPVVYWAWPVPAKDCDRVTED